MKPTFFIGIGAEKAGTSWLAKQLENHPDVWFPPLKELHYFDTIYRPQSHNYYAQTRVNALKLVLDQKEFVSKYENNPDFQAKVRWIQHFALMRPLDDDWYKQLFEPAGQGGFRAMGEITPSYSMLGRKGFQHFKNIDPEVKIIFIMRNPVDRVWSNIRFFQQNRPNTQVSSSFENMKAFAQLEGNVLRTNYVRTLGVASNVFDESNIDYDFYEDVFKNQQSQYNYLEKISDFINVPYSKNLFPMVESKVRISTEVKIPPRFERFLINKYRDSVKKLYQRIRYLPESWHETFDI